MREYYQILVDTLLGRFLPAWRRRPKRRTILAPKFYFADAGVVNLLARRGRLVPGSPLFGHAFENWIHHELQAHASYRRHGGELAYWRLASGIEVDFIAGDMALALEAKASERITSDHLQGLRSLAADHPRVRRRIVVCLEPRSRKTDDGIEIFPWRRFAEDLWADALNWSRSMAPGTINDSRQCITLLSNRARKIGKADETGGEGNAGWGNAPVSAPPAQAGGGKER